MTPLQPSEQIADLDESLRVIEEVLTRDQVLPTDLQEVLTHIQHIDHQVRYLLDEEIGNEQGLSIDRAVFTGVTPDCPMCGAPNEYTSLVYSNRRDERRLLCAECLLLMGTEEDDG